jgi:FtsH-binding integral membrane protein
VSGTGRFILGGIVGVIGILGLIGAAEAETGSLHYAGLLVFVAAIAYDFNLIRRACDEYERNRRGDRASSH